MITISYLWVELKDFYSKKKINFMLVEQMKPNFATLFFCIPVQTV